MQGDIGQEREKESKEKGEKEGSYMYLDGWWVEDCLNKVFNP